MVARAGGMPVFVRGRMHLACKSYPYSHKDEQQNHHLPGFVGNKRQHGISLHQPRNSNGHSGCFPQAKQA